MNDIKFSIITVSYNREKYIEQTIQSIIAQDYKNYEYIIIDGLSTDGTVSIIEKYQKHITFFKSEKDNSMYDAINKGLHYVTGDFVLILNSDDYLASSTIFTEVASQISLNPGKDAYFGDICIIRNMNKVRKYFQNISYKELLSSRYCRFVPHTALFVSKRVYDQMKGYDLKYKYASDFDFILKIFGAGYCVLHLDLLVTYFTEHSTSFTSLGVIDKERLSILADHSQSFPFLVKWTLFFWIWLKYIIFNMYKRSFFH